jgi:hypothetical protein
LGQGSDESWNPYGVISDFWNVAGDETHGVENHELAERKEDMTARTPIKAVKIQGVGAGFSARNYGRSA